MRASLAPGGTWRKEPLDGPAEDNHWLYRDVIFAADRFCAVGGGFQVPGNPNMARWSVSADGVRWEHFEDRSQWLGGVAYGDGWFVAAGGQGTIVRSRDCRTWTRARAGGESQRWVGFAGGVFFTGTNEGAGWQSRDLGVTWTAGNPAGATRPPHDVAGASPFTVTLATRTVVRVTDGSSSRNDSLAAIVSAVAQARPTP